MRRSTRITAAFLFAAASALAGASFGHADANLPVCSQTYGKSDGVSCNFVTYEQCRAYVSGWAGSCIDNPYYRRGSIPAPPRQRTGR